jgi:hypothetical protein
MSTAVAGQPSRGRAVWSVRRCALLLVFVFAFTALGTGSALAISRDTVLARAQSWVDKPVRYSQSRYHLGYRTDCSGYVSMCWATGTSWSTRSFHSVTRPITTAQLTPGDAMLKPGYHIRLFYGWVDDAHIDYVAYEAGTMVGSTSIRSMKDDRAFGFRPVRYRRITNSPASTNLLRNGSFDVWARSWSGATGRPVWWDTGTPRWQQSLTVVHRMDVYKTARNSLQLVNASSDPGTVTQISQTVAVSAETTYTLAAWAKTAFPAGLGLRIAYLDTAGSDIVGTRTTGDEWGIGDTSFGQMSATIVTPAQAARAVVTLELAGGSSTVGTATVAGTSAVLDAVSLVRK